jgi:hypothetical protein
MSYLSSRILVEFSVLSEGISQFDNRHASYSYQTMNSVRGGMKSFYKYGTVG